jgi:regulator of sirC expression with transglutaminase-like and TPR domain
VALSARGADCGGDISLRGSLASHRVGDIPQGGGVQPITLGLVLLEAARQLAGVGKDFLS